MPKFVFLWTDLVLWLLVAAVASSTSCTFGATPICARPGATWLHDAPAMCGRRGR